MEHTNDHLSDGESAESTNTVSVDLAPQDIPTHTQTTVEPVNVDSTTVAEVADSNPDSIEMAAETLHSICGMSNILLSLPDDLDSRSFGLDILPVVPFDVAVTLPAVPEPNFTIFGLRCDTIGDVTSWSFQGRPARITLTNQFINSWDFRGTYKATLTRADRRLEVGVRAFHQHDRALSTYLGIAQTYFHVAVQLNGFRDALWDKMTFANTSDTEWETLHELRFQDNLAGLMHEGTPVHHAHMGLRAFTAEELVEGHREKYSRDNCFLALPLPAAHHPQSRPIRLLLSAFSHWSYEMSGQTSVIGGFQGVGPLLTEAVVHDVNVPWTIGNFSRSAIDGFPYEHVCEKFCRVLDLPSLPKVRQIVVDENGEEDE